MFCWRCYCTTPPPDISLASYLALSLASGRRCCHCRSKQTSHYKIWTRRQVQIFNLLRYISGVCNALAHLSDCVFDDSHIVTVGYGSECRFALIWGFCQQSPKG